MAANQVVLCFDKQEDALLFTLAVQFANVCRRPGPQQQGRGQGCGRDSQSHSNQD